MKMKYFKLVIIICNVLTACLHNIYLSNNNNSYKTNNLNYLLLLLYTLTISHNIKKYIIYSNVICPTYIRKKNSSFFIIPHDFK